MALAGGDPHGGSPPTNYRSPVDEQAGTAGQRGRARRRFTVTCPAILPAQTNDPGEFLGEPRYQKMGLSDHWQIIFVDFCAPQAARLIYSASPVSTKHLYNIYTMLDQRRRRWADVVLMLYKCCVFSGSNQKKHSPLAAKHT